MKKNLILFFLFLFSLSFSQPVQPPFYTSDTRWADSVLNSMSLEEKIGQLIMIRVPTEKDSKSLNDVAELIYKYKVGGVIFFQGGPVRQAHMTNFFQSISCTPLFVAIDGEWGLSMRLDSTIVYPKQITLGAIKNDSLIYAMGADIAWQLQRMGIHMNFAPVVDINSNPRNPVIGSRSFSEDKTIVARKALQYMKGLQDHHIIATAKHFPGHGDTEFDSHLTLPILEHNAQRIDSLELYPFKYLFDHGVASVMTAHLNIPALDSIKGTPASLSSLITTGILKTKMAYSGLIFTDALNMKGSSNTGKPWQVGLRAFLAGNDILLMPEEIPTIIGKICDAVSDSIISEADINQRCRKVLLAKKWVGLDQYKPIRIHNLLNDLNAGRFRLLQRQLAEQSVTLLKNKQSIIPLKRLDTMRIATLYIGSDSMSLFQRYCDLYAPMNHFYIKRNASTAEYDSLFVKLESYNIILASIGNTDIRVIKNYGINDYSLRSLHKLSSKRNVVLTIFGSPYVLSKIKDDNQFSAIIMSYEDKDAMLMTAPQVIFGGIKANGQLPVTASSVFKKGDGIEQHKILRLKYSLPEDAGIASTALQPIDSIVHNAILHQAMPGCQVLVAKDGKVIYHKAFGHHTYDSLRPVMTTDIYDIASITKIAATVPAIMKLYDNNDISLNKKIVYYVPELKKSDKQNITIRELLTHQSGLQPWLPLYLSALRPVNQSERLISKSCSDKYSIRSHDFFINNQTIYNTNLISTTVSTTFNVPIADSIYCVPNFRDTLIKKIAESKLNKKEYKYSDLGFILLERAVESESDVTFDSLLNRDFYKPLGLQTMGFFPLTRFEKDRIPPTEKDPIFRRQIVHGYVNDANCAMLGGVSGHAGLFSNANDVGILMQMFLNHGIYGGKRYLSEKHIKEFVTCQKFPGNRRGLGFDKPEPDTTKQSPVSKFASLSSYGHTGFTGCMTWVDPEYNLVYVFLSNRTYPCPDVNKLAEMNIRTKIQDVIYKSFLPSR